MTDSILSREHTPTCNAVLLLDESKCNCLGDPEKVKCQTCDGCGFVADTNDMEPWIHWLHLPPESRVAISAGLVNPKACPTCDGLGRKRPVREPAPRNPQHQMTQFQLIMLIHLMREYALTYCAASGSRQTDLLQLSSYIRDMLVKPEYRHMAADDIRITRAYLEL